MLLLKNTKFKWVTVTLNPITKIARGQRVSDKIPTENVCLEIVQKLVLCMTVY